MSRAVSVATSLGCGVVALSKVSDLPVPLRASYVAGAAAFGYIVQAAGGARASAGFVATSNIFSGQLRDTESSLLSRAIRNEQNGDFFAARTVAFLAGAICAYVVGQSLKKID